jgi:hypothetical protein
LKIYHLATLVDEKNIGKLAWHCFMQLWHHSLKRQMGFGRIGDAI